MLRFLTVSMFVATLCVAGILYKIKYDTRSLQRESVALRKQILIETQQLAVLKAEWSVLTHPARIERLAREIGLAPSTPQQMISYSDLDQLPMKHRHEVGDEVASIEAVHRAPQGADQSFKMKSDAFSDEFLKEANDER